MATDVERGLLVGLLIGGGHFGGDGRQPQVTLRMHTRHSSLFSWIERTFPGGRLYGPYNHGGRHYLQWMARGAFLRDELLPMIEATLSAELDAYSQSRLDQMRTRYARRLGLGGASAEEPGSSDGPAGTDPPHAAAGGQVTEVFRALRLDEPGQPEPGVGGAS